MYYKAEFIEAIDDETLSELDFADDLSTDNMVLEYDGHFFELLRDQSENQFSLTLRSECLKTHDIEEVFLSLVSRLIPENSSIKLYDSSGSVILLNHAELEEYVTNQI